MYYANEWLKKQLGGCGGEEGEEREGEGEGWRGDRLLILTGLSTVLGRRPRCSGTAKPAGFSGYDPHLRLTSRLL